MTAVALTTVDESNIPSEIREQTLFDWVPIEKMFVAAYGRPLNARRVLAMRMKFAMASVGVLLLSYHSGTDTYAVLDGQHRMVSAREAGFKELPARVYIDLTYEQEAALYLDFATVNKQTALDRFRAKLESRDPTAVSIVAILRRFDMEIELSGAKRTGVVTAVDTLEKIHASRGLKFMEEMFAVLHMAWGTESLAWARPAIHGLDAFWVRYRDTVDTQRLVGKMHGVNPLEMENRARSLGLALNLKNPAAGYGQALRQMYNLGLRKGQLADWPMYESTPEMRAKANAARSAMMTEEKREAARERMIAGNHAGTLGQGAVKRKRALGA